jgi:hypothetical protein
MKQIAFGFFVLLLSWSSFAQQLLPTNITPLIGEVTLRFTPKHTSRCTIKTEKTKPGDSAATSSTSLATAEVYESSPGVPKYGISIGDAINYMRIVMDVKADGSGVIPNAITFDTNMLVPEHDRSQFEALKQIMTKMTSASAFSFAIGVPLRQGSVVGIGDLCQFLPGAMGTEKQSGETRVLGTMSEMGRERVIIGGEESVSCFVPGTTLTVSVKGWWAFDQQSGLIAASSSVAKASAHEKWGTSLTSEDKECVVTGELTKSATSTLPRAGKVSTPSAPSASEKKLRELKSLYNKGLIDKERYDQKVQSILRDF